MILSFIEWVLLLVLLKKEVYQNSQFRQLYLGGILLFTVVFNPGVESPSYIIAVAGAGCDAVVDVGAVVVFETEQHDQSHLTKLFVLNPEN